MSRPGTAAAWLMYHKQKLGETHWQELTGTVDRPRRVHPVSLTLGCRDVSGARANARATVCSAVQVA